MNARHGGLIVLISLVVSSRSARAGDEPTFPIAVSVAEEQGTPARDDAWIDAQIESAQELFGPIGVRFRWTTARALDARFARLETRADRDALGSQLERAQINVMVVSSLRDVDDPSRHRMGVCWQSRVDKSKRFIILSASARPTVLAHELGHFFGNGHSAVTNNVMSYSRDDSGVVFFDEAQAAIIRSYARRYRQGELTLLGPSRLFP